MRTKSTVPELFASAVFDDAAMKEKLPREAYCAMRQTMRAGRRLEPGVAEVVASAMRDWATERGATHFTHWFQPMTGVTAEKHDSFISPAEGGRIIMEFSGKELVQGEPDASSFPNGGLRATFEARGYTAWDPTSYAFLKDHTLCIPTAFCSYGGEALDEKTPLLRSIQALNKQALRILRLFGNETVQSVYPTVGAEQEYFLVDEALYEKREDLRLCGRTLLGAKPPKGQELDDHYFGSLKPRVCAFMEELNEELWKLGVLAKTEHNEVAPAQHELACIYTAAAIAADHNQLVMETMQRVARRHGLACLLHEKPFRGVNGSGKHNNWSLSTDAGTNLLEPGETPHENAQFLLFLSALIQAVDEHQDLLRIAVATAGNDCRLGGNEAPPAIVSMFLGDELTGVLSAFEKNEDYCGKEREQIKVGVHALPRFPKDATDRNRTSPFAFTGNKFEFRMPGSSLSIARVNTVLNTIAADALRGFADELEAAADFHTALDALIRRTLRAHKRILFNGNGYDAAWVQEAEKRGLLNLPNVPDCLPLLLSDKNIALFARHKVLSEAELRSRHEVLCENYCSTCRIEARVLLRMVQGEVLPAVSGFCRSLSDAALSRRALLPDTACPYEEETLRALSTLSAEAFRHMKQLRRALEACEQPDAAKAANVCRDAVFPAMAALRETADALEPLCPQSIWPFPDYGALLSSVN